MNYSLIVPATAKRFCTTILHGTAVCCDVDVVRCFLQVHFEELSDSKLQLRFVLKRLTGQVIAISGASNGLALVTHKLELYRT